MVKSLMDFDKDSFRLIVYSSVILVVLAVGIFAWFKGK